MTNPSENSNITNLEIPSEDGALVLGYLVQVKVFRPQTGIGYTYFKEGDISLIEGIGMLTSHNDDLRAMAVHSSCTCEDEDEHEG